MFNGDGGSPWSMMTVAGPVLLAIAVIYGVMRSRRRRASNDRAADNKTRQMYTGRTDGKPPEA
jgi:hypothetical protein